MKGSPALYLQDLEMKGSPALYLQDLEVKWSPVRYLQDLENRTTLPYWRNGSGQASAWQNGWHGYDNEFIDMRGFFLAKGPDFKSGVRAAPIRAVDVYNLMCRTLGVDPLPNNGSWSRVEYLLRSSVGLSRPLSLWSCCMGVFGVLLAVREFF